MNMSTVSYSESSEKDRKIQAQMSIKGTLVNTGRCPKCTLKPPCKHYATMDELNNDTSLQQKGSPRHSGKPPLPLVQKQSDVVMDSLLKAG
jgi:hypothetical protein